MAFLQGLAGAGSFAAFARLLALLGWDKAMVYPTFLASIAENTYPLDRAKRLGVFRFWRDMGYAVGTLLTGTLADAFGIQMSIVSVGLLTIVTGVFADYRMRCGSAQPTLRTWMYKAVDIKPALLIP